MKVLVVVDMQNDFVTGALANKEAQMILPNLIAKLEKEKQNDATVFFTMDSHGRDYLNTQEGKNLPVEHCITDTDGWQVVKELQPYIQPQDVCRKETFGSVMLGEYIRRIRSSISEIEIAGVCTDICVISNALLLKAFAPEIPIIVDAACCAGVTPESHETALNAMQACQIRIINRGEEPWKKE